MRLRRLFILGLLLAFAGITHATDILKVQNVEVAAGESVTLNIELSNTTTNLMGWQCDISLPEGLTLELKANGRPKAALGERFSETEHSISSTVLANGKYRFIATSMDGEAIPGTTGTLFSVTLLADASITSGTKFTGSLSHIEFNTQDNQKLTFADISFSITIPGGEEKKCATPTISFVGGKLHFECETEGVEFHYEFSASESGKCVGNDIGITPMYAVKVYASKPDFADSDEASLDINAAGIKGDANQDGKVTISDAVTVVNIILNNGEATAPAMENPAVEAAEDGEPE